MRNLSYFISGTEGRRKSNLMKLVFKFVKNFEREYLTKKPRLEIFFKKNEKKMEMTEVEFETFRLA